MKEFGKIIKLALKEDMKGLSLDKSPQCPTASELVDYLGGHLRRNRKNEIDSHLAGCMACMEDLISAEKAVESELKKGSGGSSSPKAWLRKNIWLILAMTAFALSFIYSRYFIQYLVATLVLAAKWIFETVNARILIMIYDAWKKGGEKEVSKVLERHNTRLKS